MSQWPCWSSDPADIARRLDRLKKMADTIETAAALGQNLTDAEKNNILNSEAAWSTVRYFSGLYGGPGGKSAYQAAIDSADAKVIDAYLRGRESAGFRMSTEWITEDYGKDVAILTSLLNTLEEVSYDCSWFPDLANYKALVEKTYSQAATLHGLGMKKENPSMILTAIGKLQLIEGFRDSTNLLIAYKEDYSALVGKKQTEADKQQLAEEMDKKASEQRIADEKAREEAIRAEELKLQQARSEAEIAKAAADRAKALAEELSALVEKNIAEIELYTEEKLKAEIEKQEAELQAFEARERQRISMEIADQQAKAKAEQAMEAKKHEMESRLETFRAAEASRLAKASSGGRGSEFQLSAEGYFAGGLMRGLMKDEVRSQLSPEMAQSVAEKVASQKNLSGSAREAFIQGGVAGLLGRARK